MEGVSGIGSGSIKLTGSKSISNRALLLNAMAAQPVTLTNLSDSDDTRMMQAALSGSKNLVDVHMAGTACRFLCAWLTIQEGRETILTGHNRLLERPIAPLVNALRDLGASISYMDREGFLPLKIRGTKLKGGEVSVSAAISSQFISALLMIAPRLENGLALHLKGKVLSLPYIQMTLELMRSFGVNSRWEGPQKIFVPAADIPGPQNTYRIEPDWSSAAYWYQWVAMSRPGTSLKLAGFSKNSTQADSVVAPIFEQFGVFTEFNEEGIKLMRQEVKDAEGLWEMDCRSFPDLSMSLAVQAVASGQEALLTGLDNLPLKESNRLEAVKTELAKLGAEVEIRNNSALKIKPTREWPKDAVSIDTYHDHRMALALAPLSCKVPGLLIHDAGVVSKSYPNYWEDLEDLMVV